MAQRGRPPGSDSAHTRVRVLNSARIEFATRGYAGASVATIASRAGLAPSAVYHYFGSKAALYEEVFTETVESLWLALSERSSTSLLLAMEGMLADTQTFASDYPFYADFLALSRMEASLHAEFAHLMQWRSDVQNELFQSLVEVGASTGELAGFDSIEAIEFLRALFTGWFVENHLLGSPRVSSASSISTLIRLLGSRSPSQAVSTP